jgi:hypothetical protein
MERKLIILGTCLNYPWGYLNAFSNNEYYHLILHSLLKSAITPIKKF